MGSVVYLKNYVIETRKQEKNLHGAWPHRKKKQLGHGHPAILENAHNLSKEGVNISIIKFYIHRIQLAPLGASGRLVNTHVDPHRVLRFYEHDLQTG